MTNFDRSTVIDVGVRPDGIAGAVLQKGRLRRGPRVWFHGVRVGSLVVSELVSNAVRHAVNTVTVTVGVTTDIVHLAVEDDRTGDPVMDAFEPAGRQGGRGLRVVDAVSNCWGVVPGDGNKTVWAQLARVAAA